MTIKQTILAVLIKKRGFSPQEAGEIFGLVQSANCHKLLPVELWDNGVDELPSTFLSIVTYMNAQIIPKWLESKNLKPESEVESDEKTT